MQISKKLITVLLCFVSLAVFAQSSKFEWKEATSGGLIKISAKIVKTLTLTVDFQT